MCLPSNSFFHFEALSVFLPAGYGGLVSPPVTGAVVLSCPVPVVSVPGTERGPAVGALQCLGMGAALDLWISRLISGCNLCSLCRLR